MYRQQSYIRLLFDQRWCPQSSFFRNYRRDGTMGLFEGSCATLWYQARNQQIRCQAWLSYYNWPYRKDASACCLVNLAWGRRVFYLGIQVFLRIISAPSSCCLYWFRPSDGKSDSIGMARSCSLAVYVSPLQEFLWKHATALCESEEWMECCCLVVVETL